MYFYYRAYGLLIKSVIPIPELVAIPEAEADVVVRFGEIDRSLMSATSWGADAYATPEMVSFFCDTVGAIQVQGGNEIILEPIPNMDDQVIRLPVLGVGLAVLLHQRGFLALHASAIEINGRAAIFLGGKGWGKSTLAATLYKRGHHLIADDLVAVDLRRTEHPTVIPGFPQFKLLPEAALSLGDDPERLPRMMAGNEKRIRRASERFSQNPLPIGGIYQLAKGLDLTLKPLALQEAVVQLIGNSYIARSSHQLLAGENGSLHFHHCMSVMRHVPIYRLERPQSLELVPAIAQLIEANLSTVASSITSSIAV